MFCFADDKDKDPGLVERFQRQMSKRVIEIVFALVTQMVFIIWFHVQRIGEYAGWALQVLGRVAVQKFQKKQGTKTHKELVVQIDIIYGNINDNA